MKRAKVVLEAGSDAAQWLRNHPEIVIGTIIVVGAITSRTQTRNLS